MSLRLRRRRIHFKWYYMTVAPWALAAGILVSSTASAGLEVYFGRSRITKSSFDSSVTLGALMPPSDVVPGFDRGSLPLNLLAFEHEDPYASLVSYLPPNDEMKAVITGYPVSDISEKGNPERPIVRSLSRHAFMQFGQRPAHSSLLSHRYLPSDFLSSSYNLDQVTSSPENQSKELLRQSSTPAPSTVVTGSTGTGISLQIGSGMTPSEPRAMILSSSTPIPFHLMPDEVDPLPVDQSGMSSPGGLGNSSTSRPNYSTILNGKNAEREAKCLAEAVYFEARSEPPEGQAAVAQVVLNRARSGLYPGSICGVVYQNAHRYLACQFTFACEGKSLRITEPGPWARAQKIANEVLQGKTYLAQVGASTHYHANYVKPYWSRKLNRMDKIGSHIFYTLKPGQR